MEVCYQLHLLLFSQKSDGAQVKNFKTTKDRASVKQCLKQFVEEHPAVLVSAGKIKNVHYFLGHLYREDCRFGATFSTVGIQTGSIFCRH